MNKEIENFGITDEEFEKYYSTYVKDTLLKALGITPSEYEKYLIEQRKEFNKNNYPKYFKNINK